MATEHANLEGLFTNILQSIAEKGQGELSLPQNLSAECLLDTDNINVNVAEGEDQQLVMSIAELPGVQLEIEKDNQMVQALFEKAKDGEVSVNLQDLSDMNMCVNTDGDGNMV